MPIFVATITNRNYIPVVPDNVLAQIFLKYSSNHKDSSNCLNNNILRYKYPKKREKTRWDNG